MDIYQHFLTHRLVASKREFSAMLNRAENYLCLRGERGPSADALIELFQTLWCQGRLVLAVRVAWTILWLKPEARR